MTQSNNSNNNGIMAIIVLLLVIIAGGAFYIGKNMGHQNTPYPVQQAPLQNEGTPTAQPEASTSSVEITVITDERCGAACDTSQLLTQLEQVPNLAGVDIQQLDYADEGAKEMLEAAGIQTLPAALFSHKFIKELADFLQPTANGKYFLELGSTYDPTIVRSENGFRVLDDGVLQKIREGTYTKGNPDAKITWFEYSDLECPFCARLHSQGTPGEVMEKYGDDLNIVFQHFPLDFHANAMPGAQLLECLGEEKGSDAFYTVIKASFAESNSTMAFLMDEAEKVGGNKETLQKCVDDGTYKEKVSAQMQAGTSIFGVTGTPGNAIVNNETGEFEVISGAYPSASFIEIIDKMLK